MLLKRRIILILLVFLFSGGFVFGFDNLVIHPKLAETASLLYNQSSAVKLSNQEILWIVQGSIAEDADPRYLNHYYNPATGKGLDDEFALGLPAKEWAQKQNSATGDYSESAVFFNYRQGNYQRAYQGLGHILHLVQDMAVPAHTRNDSHPEGDPFELWASVNGNISSDSINKVNVNNLSFAFDGLANYSNNHFFSKDTIAVNPEKIVDRKIVKYKNENYTYVYCKDNFNDIYICAREIKTPSLVYYSIDEPLVHSDYWNLLYPKAIGYSAGVIEYFQKGFAQIDREKAEEAKLSFWQRIGNKFTVWYEEIKYTWGDVYMVSRVSAGPAWGILTSAPSSSIVGSQNQVNNSDDGEILAEKIDSQSEAEAEIDELMEKEKENQPVEEIKVKYVVDGDTIILESGEVVRYIGVNAPELGEPGSQDDECLAWVARIRNMEFLQTGKISLIKDPAFDKDKEGRLLRYVYSGDKMMNEKMALSGLAISDFCQFKNPGCVALKDKNREGLIKNAFVLARENKRGLFSGVCKEADKIIKPSDQEIKYPEESLKATTTAELVESDFKSASSTEETALKPLDSPIIGNGGGFSWIGPSSSDFKINSFNLFDLRTGSIYFSASSTIGLNLETDSMTVDYFLSTASTTPEIDDENWFGEFPLNFQLEETNGLKTVYVWLKKDNRIVSSASSAIYLDTVGPELSLAEKPDMYSLATTSDFRILSSENEVALRYAFDGGAWQIVATNTVFSNDSVFDEGNHVLNIEGIDLAGNIGSSTYNWLVDLTAPTSTILNLDNEYATTGFFVNWSGVDSELATSSGIETFDLEYKINNGDWLNWISLTASSSAMFDQIVDPGSEIYFRVRARDCAGNLGEWSDLASTKISSPHTMVNHLVISEIQIGGQTASDEFVELYNASSSEICLANYKLTKKNSSGNESNLLTKFPDVCLPAFSFYLIAHPSGYKGSTVPDAVYSSASYSLSSNSTVILYDDKLEVVDKVGFGEALDYETKAYSGIFESGNSIERKAIASSTSDLMSSDHFYGGNSYDSNNNDFDFVERQILNPQNMNSKPEDPAFFENYPEHQWLFTEEDGLTVIDQIAEDDLTLASSTLRGGDFVQLAAGEKIVKQFSWSEEKKDFSISFWVNHKNSRMPLSISLNNSSGNKIFSLNFNQAENFLSIGEEHSVFSHSRLRDGLWAYITLVYDYDKSQILLYVHGDLVLTLDNIIFNESINELNIENSVEATINDNSLFNLIIWSNPVVKYKIIDNKDKDIDEHPDLWQVFAC